MKTLLFLFLILPFFVFSQQNYSYKNLVFEGGGIRGLAYPGALQVLEQKGIVKNIERVAGTSAGAITALLVSLGYNSHEIDSIIYTLKVQQLNDGKNIFGKIRRIKKEYGIFKGDKFERWLGQIIKNKTGNINTTFFELHQLHLNNNKFKDVYCTGTNITLQKLIIFSWINTPAMQIKTAVHISGCIPVYFKPVAIDSMWNEVSVKKSKIKYDLYVDGGMMNNYPINIFDTCINGDDPFVCEEVNYNYQTLGLKLERQEQIQQFENGFTDIAPYPVSSLNNYLMAINNLLQEALGRKTINLKNEKGRTIYISYGNIFGKPRKVSEEEKKYLFENGVKAAEEFLNSHQVN
ncbi:MAG: patatin-like phospholipase family protein [Ginsengibacter sp.]